MTLRFLSDQYSGFAILVTFFNVTFSAITNHNILSSPDVPIPTTIFADGKDASVDRPDPFVYRIHLLDGSFLVGVADSFMIFLPYSDDGVEPCTVFRIESDIHKNSQDKQVHMPDDQQNEGPYVNLDHMSAGDFLLLVFDTEEPLLYHSIKGQTALFSRTFDRIMKDICGESYGYAYYKDDLMIYGFGGTMAGAASKLRISSFLDDDQAYFSPYSLRVGIGAVSVDINNISPRDIPTSVVIGSLFLVLLTTACSTALAAKVVLNSPLRTSFPVSTEICIMASTVPFLIFTIMAYVDTILPNHPACEINVNTLANPHHAGVTKSCPEAALRKWYDVAWMIVMMSTAVGLFRSLFVLAREQQVSGIRCGCIGLTGVLIFHVLMIVACGPVVVGLILEYRTISGFL